MNKSQPTWQDRFQRESGIRRGLILHGNAVDVTPAPDSPGRLVSIPVAVTQLLKARGYRHIVLWDRVEGVSGVDARTWQSLQQQGVPVAMAAGAEDFDMGGVSLDAPPANGRMAGQTIPASPEDLLSVIIRCMQNPGPEPVAFVLDWTQYLFGNANALSESERGWLLRMGKAARDADAGNAVDDNTRPRTLMVLLCQGISVLPPTLYLNNPLFKDIGLPLPSRQLRADTLRSQMPMLNVDPLLLDGSRELEDLVDAMDGLTLRDIQNLVRLSRQTRPGGR